MATDILCKAVRYKNPKTGELSERAAVVNKEYDSSALFDYASNSGFVPAGSKKEVIVPGFGQMMAAAKSLIETTGDAKVVFADWLTIAVGVKKATLENGAIPDSAKLVTSLRVHKDLKIDPARFNLVLEGYDESLVPRIEFAISDVTGADRGRLVKDAAIMLAGRGFGEELEGAVVKFVWNDGSETTGTLVTCSDSLVKVAAVPEFADLDSGTEITITVTHTVDGTGYTSAEKKVVIA